MPSPLSINWDAIDTIKRASARFRIVSRSAGLEIVRAAISIQPTTYYNVGSPVYRRGTSELVGKRLKSVWDIGSEDLGITTRDTNVHVEALLAALDPWRDQIVRWSEQFDVGFQTYLTSTSAYQGDGPQLATKTLLGIVELKASLGCNVICDSEHTGDDQESSRCRLEAEEPESAN